MPVIPLHNYCIAANLSAVLDGPVLILIGVCALLGVLACVYLWKLNDQDEWERSSLRKQAPSKVEVPPAVDQPVATSAASAGPVPSRFQRFVEYPIFLGYAGFALGGLIPALLILIAGGEALEDTRYELIVFYGILFLWNIFFTQLFKFRLKLPIFPIPITWVVGALALIGLWDLCLGSY